MDIIIVKFVLCLIRFYEKKLLILGLSFNCLSFFTYLTGLFNYYYIDGWLFNYTFFYTSVLSLQNIIHLKLTEKGRSKLDLTKWSWSTYTAYMLTIMYKVIETIVYGPKLGTETVDAKSLTPT